MAKAIYKGNKLRVIDLPHGIELTGPQAHSMNYLWTGLGSAPNKAVKSSLYKIGLIENPNSDFPSLTQKGKEVVKDLLPLFKED